MPVLVSSFEKTGLGSELRQPPPPLQNGLAQKGSNDGDKQDQSDNVTSLEESNSPVYIYISIYRIYLYSIYIYVYTYMYVPHR